MREDKNKMSMAGRARRTPEMTICQGSLARQTQPTPASADRFPVRDTESDPPWDWLGLACETNTKDARIMSSLSKGSFASQIQRAAWIAKAISAAVGSG